MNTRYIIYILIERKFTLLYHLIRFYFGIVHNTIILSNIYIKKRVSLSLKLIFIKLIAKLHTWYVNFYFEFKKKKSSFTHDPVEPQRLNLLGKKPCVEKCIFKCNGIHEIVPDRCLCSSLIISLSNNLLYNKTI